jgi:hypothetical protein
MKLIQTKKEEKNEMQEERGPFGVAGEVMRPGVDPN